MVLSLDPLTRNMNVQVDPGQANAWRREPYYGQLKRWAAASVPLRRHVLVHVNKATTVVLPDRDVSLGMVAADERIVSRRTHDPAGPELRCAEGPGLRRPARIGGRFGLGDRLDRVASRRPSAGPAGSGRGILRIRPDWPSDPA